MSAIPDPNKVSAPLPYPTSVRYEAVRTTWRHEDDGELERGFITIKALCSPSPEELQMILCTCELQWAYLVTPAKPEFTCTYNRSNDRFMDFKAPNFLEDSTGMNLGYTDSDDEALIEIGKAIVENREPEVWITRYPGLVVKQSGVFDDSGYEFLLVHIIFDPDNDVLCCGSWESKHNVRKVWFKRVVKGTDTGITEEERARLAAGDLDDECSKCRCSEDEEAREEEDERSMGGNGDDGL